MLTIVKGQTQVLKFLANPRLLSPASLATLKLTSRNNADVIISNKPVTLLGMGLFSINVTDLEVLPLRDDSYSYAIYDGDTLLDLGFVRLVEGENNNTVLDYLLDFLLG